MFRFFKVIFSPIIAILDFITKYFKTIVFLTILYFFTFDKASEPLDINDNANLQKISLFGPILGVDKTLEQIRKAQKDDNIKGVLFEVNSPGGAVAPSVELAYAIKELKKVKPVVVYASGTIASGSYYASIWANKIIANPGSMVGSIGVIFQGINAQELLAKIGLSAQTVKAGKYKESGTPMRAWTQYEKEELQAVIDDTYDMFISDVSSARKLKKENHTIFANARIFTANQAKKVGLIDIVGTFSVAQNELKKLAKVHKAVWKKQDKFEKFMNEFIEKTSSKISSLLNPSLKAY